MSGAATDVRWPSAIAGRAEEASWRLGWLAAANEAEAILVATIPAPETPITVTLHCDEITTLDPRTHQPDFVTAEIVYRPRRRLIDSKDLHRYIVGLRDHGHSMERLTTVLARVVARSCEPEWVEVTVHEKPRGGVAITAACRLAGPSSPGGADR